MNYHSRQAFTLVEILVAVSVVGVLTVIPVVAYSQISRNARDTKRKQDIDTVTAALQQYRQEMGTYPAAVDYDDLDDALVPKYLSRLPNDPDEDSAYEYAVTPDGAAFTLMARLDSRSGDNRENYVAIPGGRQIITGVPQLPTRIPSPTGISPLQLTLTPRATRTPTPVPLRSPTPTPSILITPYALSAPARSIVRGPDGNMWMTLSSAGSGQAIAKATSQGEVSSYPLSAPHTNPGQIISGPNANLWFIGNPTTIGAITASGALTNDAATLSQSVQGLADGGDNSVWITVGGSTTRTLSSYTPNPLGGSMVLQNSITITGSDPRGVVRATDGAIWFIGLSNPNRVGRYVPGSANPEYFPIDIPGNPAPIDIVSGLNGQVWVGFANGSLYRVQSNGALTEFASGLQTLQQIALGNDRSIWFIGSIDSQGRIGQLSPSGQRIVWEFPEQASDVIAGAGRTIWVTASASSIVYKVTY